MLDSTHLFVANPSGQTLDAYERPALRHWKGTEIPIHQERISAETSTMARRFAFSELAHARHSLSKLSSALAESQLFVSRREEGRRPERAARDIRLHSARRGSAQNMTEETKETIYDKGNRTSRETQQHRLPEMRTDDAVRPAQ